MGIRYFFQLLYIKKLQTTHFEQFIYDLPLLSNLIIEFGGLRR